MHETTYSDPLLLTVPAHSVLHLRLQICMRQMCRSGSSCRRGLLVHLLEMLQISYGRVITKKKKSISRSSVFTNELFFFLFMQRRENVDKVIHSHTDGFALFW